MSAPRVVAGDARQLRELGFDEGSVDCVVTSPPYWDLKRYDERNQHEIGHAEATYEDYVAAVGDVFESCLWLTKPTGVMWVVADTLRARGAEVGRQLPLPFDLAREAEKRGWRLQETVVWVKNKTLPYSGQGKLRNLIEYILFFTRSRDFKHYPYRFADRHLPDAEWLAGWPERYHPLGRRPANVWHIPIPTQGIWTHSERLHFCPLPQQLVARCLGLTTDKDDVVFDPFAGIGTVPAQAVAMGRAGLGVELSADNVRAFESNTLPAFQAAWEAGASRRRLSREDQRNEGTMILKLRLLKTGKELIRVLERLAQDSPAGHPAAAVEGVLVEAVDELGDYIDIEQGTVARPSGRFTLVGDVDLAGRDVLRAQLDQTVAERPFTSFGVDLQIEFCSPEAVVEVPQNGEELLEFGQSRHGAFTAALDGRLFPARPRLMTTIRLAAAVQAGTLTPLELARRAGERQLLQQEIARCDDPVEVAAKLGIPGADLDDLLVRHGLREEPRSFAIPLPDQLSVLDDYEPLGGGPLYLADEPIG